MKLNALFSGIAVLALGMVQPAEAQTLTSEGKKISPFIDLNFEELPAYAKCAVSVAKASMPADYEMEITRYSIPKQDKDRYAVTIGKYDEHSDKGLRLEWQDKGGKPLKKWELEYNAEVYMGMKSSVMYVEIAQVDSYLGGTVGPAFNVVSERWIKDRPAVEIAPTNIARVYNAIRRTCDLVG